MKTALIRVIRIAVALMMTVGALSFVSIANAGNANACSMKYHCYGVVQGTGRGGYVEIYPACLWTTPGNLATEEMWVGNAYNQWVEAGYDYQNNMRIDGDTKARTGRYAFWAKQTPSAWSYHILETYPSLAKMTVELYWNSTNYYNLILNTTNHHQVSIYNPMSTSTIDVMFGSESTSNYSHSVNDQKYIQSELSGPTDWRSGAIWPRAYIKNAPMTLNWLTSPTAFRSGISCSA